MVCLPPFFAQRAMDTRLTIGMTQDLPISLSGVGQEAGLPRHDLYGRRPPIFRLAGYACEAGHRTESWSAHFLIWRAVGRQVRSGCICGEPDRRFRLASQRQGEGHQNRHVSLGCAVRPSNLYHCLCQIRRQGKGRRKSRQTFRPEQRYKRHRSQKSKKTTICGADVMADLESCQARLPLQVTSLTGWARQEIADEQSPQESKSRHALYQQACTSNLYAQKPTMDCLFR